jgi:hypothetical protein
LKDHGVNYNSFTEPYLDSLGPFGDVIVSMLVTIAAQDLIKISENMKATLAKKKAAGVQLGAPRKSADFIAQVRRLKGSGTSNQAIARETCRRVAWLSASYPNRNAGYYEAKRYSKLLLASTSQLAAPALVLSNSVSRTIKRARWTPLLYWSRLTKPRLRKFGAP